MEAALKFLPFHNVIFTGACKFARPIKNESSGFCYEVRVEDIKEKWESLPQ